MLWFYGYFPVAVVLVVIGSIAFGVSCQIALAVLLAFALAELWPQMKFVMINVGDRYTRRPWGMPLGVVALAALSVVLAGIVGAAVSSNFPTSPPRSGTEKPILAPAVPLGARPLTVSVNTVSGLTWWEAHFNQALCNVGCYAMLDRIIITFDVDTEKWGGYPAPVPLLVRLFDRNGQYLTHFMTRETFSPLALVVTGCGEPAVKLKAKGNRFEYTVNTRDMRDAEMAEIGVYIEEPR
jgi:hypothetical protein